MNFTYHFAIEETGIELIKPLKNMLQISKKIKLMMKAGTTSTRAYILE